ncbi:MAG: hypothetical protein K0R24_441 [Gammaproteobacteria bacterium]|jgi:putative Mg2+ transporter-C (MgtC) family protein|nr:hypothetical protein [Gammaproteobacteria bacterium]MCE3237460.1 hypothetical protein [Gammaproteobacteria bacterium]
MIMDGVDFHTELAIVFRIFIAFLLGALIGWERERHGVSAGSRTYGAICLGACAFTVVSLSIVGADPSRVAAQVATGIGFLGGGVIFRQDKYINGLTTAGIGLAVACGMYMISITTSALLFLLLYLPRFSWWKKISTKNISRLD